MPDEVERFRPAVGGARRRIPELLVGAERERLQRRIDEFDDAGAPADLAADVAACSTCSPCWTSPRCRGARARTWRSWRSVYFTISARFEIDRLLSADQALPRGDRWAALARSALRATSTAALAVADPPGGAGHAGRWLAGRAGGRLGAAQRRGPGAGPGDAGRDRRAGHLRPGHPVGGDARDPHPRRAGALTAAARGPRFVAPVDGSAGRLTDDLIARAGRPRRAGRLAAHGDRLPAGDGRAAHDADQHRDGAGPARDARPRSPSSRRRPSVPNLWDDPAAAQQVTSRLSFVQGELRRVEALRQRVDDLPILVELAEAEGDAETPGRGRARARRTCRRRSPSWRSARCSSGEYDSARGAGHDPLGGRRGRRRRLGRDAAADVHALLRAPRLAGRGLRHLLRRGGGHQVRDLRGQGALRLRDAVGRAGHAPARADQPVRQPGPPPDVVRRRSRCCR